MLPANSKSVAGFSDTEEASVDRPEFLGRYFPTLSYRPGRSQFLTGSIGQRERPAGHGSYNAKA
jgi:hypothetical protein